jgi:hypothetical protein
MAPMAEAIKNWPTEGVNFVFILIINIIIDSNKKSIKIEK